MSAAHEAYILALLVRKPETYLARRTSVLVFSIVWIQVLGSPMAVLLRRGHCSAEGDLLFWIAEISNSAFPWLVLDAFVYPVPLPAAVWAHGVSWMQAAVWAYMLHMLVV